MYFSPNFITNLISGDAASYVYVETSSKVYSVDFGFVPRMIWRVNLSVQLG
jgi:hypothetical protein